MKFEDISPAMMAAAYRRLDQRIAAEIGGWLQNGGYRTIDEIADMFKVDRKGLKNVLRQFAGIPNGKLYQAWLVTLRLKGMSADEVTRIKEQLQMRPRKIANLR